MLIRYLDDGKSVANEYAWITKQWRDRAQSVAKDHGYETKIVYLKLPREEIIKRWKVNDTSRKRFHWPEEEFNRMFTEFEEPTLEEDVNHLW